MEITEMMAKSPFWAAKMGSGTAKKYSPEELIRRECDNINSTHGELTGGDCPKCLNKGFVAYVDGDYVSTRPCECMVKRQNLWRVEASGISRLLAECTFDKYKATDPWQTRVLEKARNYAKNPEGWFYIGGQVGSGKTHICTAITGELMNRGFSARYMLWQDESRELKANTMEDDYNKRMDELKLCGVLYIDDFFKVKNSPDKKDVITNADIKVAFELLNYRYINRLPTIISGERSAQALVDIDEAIASRIIQRCGENAIDIERDKARNYRLRRAK